MSFIKNLDWRFATKQFDNTKVVSDEDLQKITRAIQMAPSSFGLQPFHVYVISDQKLKENIKPIARDQAQIDSCSHLFVFCAVTSGAGRVDQYIDALSGGDQTKKESQQARAQRMKQSMVKKGELGLRRWADNQVYLALGFALAACAELKIDACPMGGFSHHELDEFLQLPKYLHSTVLMTIGYRGQEPKYPKFRFNDSDLFTFMN